MTSAWGRRILVTVLALGLAGLALTHVGALGASWSEALARLAHLDRRWPLILGVVWLLGLAAHTILLTAALPGLTHLRALTLNVAGNAVANILPLGGVAGTALNLGMARSWGHSGADFVRFALVSKAWDLVAKLTMPVVAIGALLVAGRVGPNWALLTGSLLSAVAGVLLVMALSGHLRLPQRGVRSAQRGVESGNPGSRLVASAGKLETTRALIRRRWPALTVGMAGYLALQGVLLWLCLAAVGLRLPATTLFAALVAGRVLSLVSITPAGAGFVEAGTVAVLAALRIDATGGLAGLLLYRAFVLFAEVPVGGFAIAAWALKCSGFGSIPPCSVDEEVSGPQPSSVLSFSFRQRPDTASASARGFRPSARRGSAADSFPLPTRPVIRATTATTTAQIVRPTVIASGTSSSTTRRSATTSRSPVSPI